MKIVFDIETTALPFDSLSESQQEFLLRQAEKERDEELRQEKIEEAHRYLNLYPFTAKVIAIGMLNTESEGSLVLYEGSDEEWQSENENVKYKALSEPQLLSAFWDYASRAEQVITFNGRLFDIPFLMLRSAVLKVKPTVNYLGNRYDHTRHLDLIDMFSFYGLTRKFNLDFYCRAFGIESPKSKGVTGMDVNELYKAGKTKEIAVYCADDIKATYELYKIWNNYLNI